jgi:predicted Zn-dependent peptidase
MGRPIIGTEDNVRSFVREDFVTYMQSHYVSNATTVIVSGSFDEKTITEKIQQYFGNVTEAAKPNKDLVFESQNQPELSLYFRDTDQTHLAFGFRSFSISDPRIPAMSILSTILGKGMSSRLFSKMRDELGICYYVGADHNPFTDHGYFGISAGVDNSRVQEAVKGILEECTRLKEEKISEDELQRAKDHIAGTTMLELETSDSRAEFFGYEEVLKGKVDDPQVQIDKINKVTAAEVQKLAVEIFQNSGLNLALVGKFKDEGKLREILNV